MELANSPVSATTKNDSRYFNGIRMMFFWDKLYMNNKCISNTFISGPYKMKDNDDIST